MQEKRGLNGSTLKIMAMCSMLIDHTAYVLLGAMLVKNGIFNVGNLSAEYISGLMGQGSVGYLYLAYLIMRMIIGRFAFPIFCFLLVEGFQKTRSKTKYAVRLFLFALISEVPFDMAFSMGTMNWNYQNVFFTLFLGFLTIWGMDEISKRELQLWVQRGAQVLLFLAGAFLAELICCDYGAYGIIAISVLYLFRFRKRDQLLAGCLSFFWEFTAMLAFIPIAFYNGKRGLKLKYVFYAFYPVHLLILYALLKVIF